MTPAHHLSAIASLAIAACAVGHVAPPSPQHALAPSGKLRIGVYVDSPISLVRDAATRAPRGVAYDTGREVARRLGVDCEVVEFPRVAEVVTALRAGEVDITVTNATAERAKSVDFTQPILLLELGYLVAPGSTVASIADADRAGMRIGVMQGSTSQTTLPRQLAAATVVPAASMKLAIEMLSRHELDAFATNKANLFELSASVPGSRVLDDDWGAEHLAIAIPKGRDRARPWLERFVAETRRDGFVARAVARAGLRGTASAELHVVVAAGFAAAYRALVPEFERATHVVVQTTEAASPDGTAEAIADRLRGGEPADVVIAADSELEALIRQGKVVAGSRVDLARAVGALRPARQNASVWSAGIAAGAREPRAARQLIEFLSER